MGVTWVIPCATSWIRDHLQINLHPGGAVICHRVCCGTKHPGRTRHGFGEGEGKPSWVLEHLGVTESP